MADIRNPSLEDPELARILQAVRDLHPLLQELAGTLSPAEQEILDSGAHERMNLAEYNQGARVADDNFCDLCGARGAYSRYCSDCSRGLNSHTDCAWGS